MSVLEWIVISTACLLVFLLGYAGVTGKSIFSYKDHSKQRHKRN